MSRCQASSDLPDAARAAWWVSCWLAGRVSTDDTLDALRGGDAAHHVTELPGTDEAVPLALALGRLRSAGAVAAGLALPAEGDPVGLAGPPTFNAAALEQGSALVLIGADLGLVPVRAGRGVVWRCLPAQRRQPGDVGEADRALRAAVPVAATALAELDVARWGPEVADELMDLRRPADLDAPGCVPPECVTLAARAVRLLRACALATEATAALPAAGEAGRHDALAALARTARRALVAACSPDCWPDGDTLLSR